MVGVAFLAGVSITALLTVPIQHSVSGSIQASSYRPADGDYVGGGIATYPARAEVHLDWTETGLSSSITSPVMFSVYPVNGGDGCWVVSSGGYCSFTATGAPYEFFVSGQAGTGVSYSGSYAVPALNYF